MSDIELIKCISNLMTKRSEIIESINNDLKEEYDRIIRSNRRDLHKIRSENEEMERQYRGC